MQKSAAQRDLHEPPGGFAVYLTIPDDINGGTDFEFVPRLARSAPCSGWAAYHLNGTAGRMYTSTSLSDLAMKHRIGKEGVVIWMVYDKVR